jgi:hypothetical protein
MLQVLPTDYLTPPWSLEDPVTVPFFLAHTPHITWGLFRTTSSRLVLVVNPGIYTLELILERQA